jgi:L-alanine-DL-glutamate epimerase-like enolase superfamily enzyme
MTRIKTLSAYDVRVPLPAPVALATMRITARDYTIVEIVDEDGTMGRAVGYARGAPVADVVGRMLAPSWQGAEVAEPTALYDRTVRANAMQGTHGIFWRALSLADLALHDLLSRRAGVPLAAFLGGTIRPVETTLAGCYPVASETPETIAALMATMASYGSAGIKVTSSGDFAHDTGRLRTCRKALGEGTPLIVDLYSCAPDARTLLPHARDWGALGMGWLEDPFGFDDFDQLALLADGLDYPVGVGDEQAGLSHFRNLIDHGHIRVVRLDATTCGGVSGFRRIAALAAERGLPVSCHVFHHLHAQLATLLPQAMVEFMLPETGIDATHLLFRDDLRWDSGRLVPGDRPGLGVDWDEDALARFRVRN